MGKVYFSKHRRCYQSRQSVQLRHMKNISIEIDKKTLITAIIGFVIGVVLTLVVAGCMIGGKSRGVYRSQYRRDSMAKMHQMDNGMHTMMQDMTSRMEGKTGDALDQTFLEDMIVHHQGAVDMAKMLQANTKRPELQKMATDIVTVQTKEIEMMQGWLTEWFKK